MSLSITPGPQTDIGLPGIFHYISIANIVRDYLPIGIEGLLRLNIFHNIRPFTIHDITNALEDAARGDDLRELMSIQQYILKSGAIIEQDEGKVSKLGLNVFPRPAILRIIHASMDNKTVHCFEWAVRAFDAQLREQSFMPRLTEAIEEGRKGMEDWVLSLFPPEDEDGDQGMDYLWSEVDNSVALVKYGNLMTLQLCFYAFRIPSISESLIVAAVHAGDPYIRIVAEALGDDIGTDPGFDMINEACILPDRKSAWERVELLCDLGAPAPAVPYRLIDHGIYDVEMCRRFQKHISLEILVSSAALLLRKPVNKQIDPEAIKMAEFVCDLGMNHPAQTLPIEVLMGLFRDLVCFLDTRATPKK